MRRDILSSSLLPDIAKNSRVELGGCLDRVGMSRIELPVQLVRKDDSVCVTPARAEAFISLDDPHVKGIHMSRLFLTMQDYLEKQPLCVVTLRNLLKAFVRTHNEISKNSYVKIDFDFLVKRPALVSQFEGWRTYPVTMIGRYEDGEFSFELGFEVMYSSTCPCSAALTRQLIQQDFREHFGFGDVQTNKVYEWLGRPLVASPHSQRSNAFIKIVFDSLHENFKIEDYIDLVEITLQTPVQGAVKREDEQEFARLNGNNLMFCEDAARRIKQALEGVSHISDYWFKVEHQESLHPHNAVSIVTKGIKGGFRPS